MSHEQYNQSLDNYSIDLIEKDPIAIEEYLQSLLDFNDDKLKPST